MGYTDWEAKELARKKLARNEELARQRMEQLIYQDKKLRVVCERLLKVLTEDSVLLTRVVQVEDQNTFGRSGKLTIEYFQESRSKEVLD